SSRSQGNSVFIRVSSRLRCAGEVLVLLLDYLVCEVQKVIVHKSGATKLTRSQENLLWREIDPTLDAVFGSVRHSSGCPRTACGLRVVHHLQLKQNSCW